jgi:hypothetical protein
VASVVSIAQQVLSIVPSDFLSQEFLLWIVLESVPRNNFLCIAPLKQLPGTD